MIQSGTFGWRQPLAAFTVLLALVGAVAGVIWWVATAPQGALTRAQAVPLPAYMVDAMTSEAQQRILVINTTDSGSADPTYSDTYTIYAGDGYRLGDDSTVPEPSDKLTSLVTDLVSEATPEDVSRLADLGIAYVAVPAPYDTDQVAQLDGLPGLTRASTNPRLLAGWQVNLPTGLVRVEEANGSPAEVAAGATVLPSHNGSAQGDIEAGSERVLRVATDASDGFSAQLDGQQLDRVDVASGAGFRLGPEGGSVSVDPGGHRGWWVLLQVLADPGRAGAGGTHDAADDGRLRGRRGAAMSSAVSRSALGAAAAVAVSAVAIVLTSVVGPTPAEIDRTPTSVPASQAQLSCPETTTGSRISTGVLAVAPPLDEAGSAGGSSPGRLSLHTLSTDPAAQDHPLDETDQVGVPIVTSLDEKARPAVTVDAVDGLAPAAYAAQRTVLNAGQDVGLAVAPCSATADSWWFTGVDTAVGSTSRLVLSNPTPAVATVDLTFYGPKGIENAVGARGIPIAPRSRQSLDLARFAPGRDAVAVHVRATRGRVAAAVDVSRVNGVTAAGNEWLAPSELPSSDVLVNAGDSGDGEQRLVLTNPSGHEALVQVQVLDESGSFTPKSLTDVRVRPGRTVVKDVSDVTDRSASALHVTTDQEQATIVASLVSENARLPVDFSTASSSAPLTGPAVVPIFSDTTVSLAFAGRQGGGDVQVQAYDAKGAPVGDVDRVAVKAKTTTSVDIHATKDTAYLVATAAQGSQLQGIATYHGRTGLSAVPIVSAPTTVTRPAVRPAG